jgi:hypothetical protein
MNSEELELLDVPFDQPTALLASIEGFVLPVEFLLVVVFVIIGAFGLWFLFQPSQPDDDWVEQQSK